MGKTGQPDEDDFDTEYVDEYCYGRLRRQWEDSWRRYENSQQNWTSFDGNYEGVDGKPRELMLPDPNGHNKYTRGMLPGYTGYVPTSPYKYGDRYRVMCDRSVDELMRANQRYQLENTSLRQTVANQTVLKSAVSDSQVKASCDRFRDRNPKRSLLQEDKRTGNEAPMPGYVGYIPKVIPTEIGLGARYHTVSKNGLTVFYDELSQTAANKNSPISLDERPAPKQFNVSFRLDSPSNRVYSTGGMVPNYTGYLPPDDATK